MAELNAEVNRITGHVRGLPVQLRRKAFDEEVEKLPAAEREIVRSLLAAALQLSEYFNGRLVILVHGIRTRAEWQGPLRNLFEQDGETIVEPLGYGYFNVIRFLCPFGTRAKPVNEILLKIRDALHMHRDSKREVIFIGHSFGAYILGTILRQNPDIRPERLLLCGSVLPRTFRWDTLANRPKSVMNEVGSRDIWPIFANSVTWGYGSTGTFGFQTAGVRDRYHNISHSDYFKAGFAERFWLPWIQSGNLVPTEFDSGVRPTTPFYKNFIEIVQIKWVFVASLIVVISIFIFLRGGHYYDALRR